MAGERFANFDFSNMKFENLDFEGFTGSKASARPFSFLEQARDVKALRSGFRGEMVAFKTGVHRHLAESLEELQRTRAIAEKVYSARIKSLDENQTSINGRIARAKGVPGVAREPNIFKIAGKLRDTDAELGLPNLVGEAFVKQGETIRVLMRSATDAEGNFEFALDQDKVKEGQDVFVRFLTADEKIVAGVEECVGCQRVGAKTLMISADATDQLRPYVEAANSLLTKRRASLASVNAKKKEVQTERTATLKELDTQISQCQQMIELLEEELPESDDRPARLLGNSSTQELHNLDNLTRQCQIDEIRFDRRVDFKTVNEARKAGYDLCAYCFGKERSTR